MGAERTKVFISYSHMDRRWMERLQVHLKPLEREEMLDFWVDTDIVPGQQWYAEIEDAIAKAKVAVLLISPDFLASDFIATEELPRVLSAADKDGLKVIPLFLAPSNVGSFKRISRFQGVNDPQSTLVSLSPAEQDELLVKTSEAIIKALEAPIKPWKKRSFRRYAMGVGALLALTVALWMSWPDLQARSTNAVMLVPDPYLYSRLPPVDGAVTRPYRLELTFQGRSVSVDTMRYRIYVLGGDRDVLNRVVDRLPEDERFAPIRTFLRGFNLKEQDFEKAYNLMTDNEPAYIESPKMNADETFSLQITRENNGETETLLQRAITIEDKALTTIILTRDEG